MEIEEAKMKEKELALKEQEKKVEELKNNDDNNDAMEDETTCCMCYDILLKAHSLECGHTMCHQCIREWMDEKKPNAECPVCRSKINNEPTPCRVLDNIIEEIYFKNKPQEVKKEYEDRKNEYKTWKIAYGNNNNNNNNVFGGGGGFNWAAWGNNNNN
eukprot:755895_1